MTSAKGYTAVAFEGILRYKKFDPNFSILFQSTTQLLLRILAFLLIIILEKLLIFPRAPLIMVKDLFNMKKIKDSIKDGDG